ncbi:MAG TPA: sel1 repeat family protein [Rudaea sp.]
MRSTRKGTKYCIGMLAVLSLAAPAHAEHDPLNDPEVQRALQAMKDTSTWFHPDLFGEYTGMRRYAHHQYRAALKYFEIGAFYADKLSQLSLGLMYMNGEGTPKDPVTAYAWLDLAAERDYPDFVATRDTLKARLMPGQLARAMVMREKLAEKYGDGVAKHRLLVQIRQGVLQGVPQSGSRTGFEHGNYWRKDNPNCEQTLAGGGQEQRPATCGKSVFANVQWDPDLYFAWRDSQYEARVSVGAVQQLGKAIDKPPQQSQAAQNATTDPNDKPAQH